MVDSAIFEQGYSYFLTEAQDLLQAIEQDLFDLKDNRSPGKVHSLMRSAHTLKGAAASVGVESVKTMAHALEDVFRSLYNPEVAIDNELEMLLFEGYDCLRVPITAAVAKTPFDETQVINRATQLFERLQAKLGDQFDPAATIPSSAELGFDITRSIFESGVNERLDELANALASNDTTQVINTLQNHAEVFVGLAESLGLPGFGEIVQLALTAVTQYPERATVIAQAALVDLRKGQADVLAGDRIQGGKPSATLKQLANESTLTLNKSTPTLPVTSTSSRSRVDSASSPPQTINSNQQLEVNVVPSNPSSQAISLKQSSFVSAESANLGLGKLWKQARNLIRSTVEKMNSEAPATHSDQPQTSSPQKVLGHNTSSTSETASDDLALFIEPPESQNPTYFSDSSSELEALGDFSDFITSDASDAEENALSLEELTWEDDSAIESLGLLLDATDQDLWATPGSGLILSEQAEILLNDNSNATEPVQPTPDSPVEISKVTDLEVVKDTEPVKLQPASAKETAPASQTVRVSLDHLEILSHTVGELLINQNRQSLQDERLQKLIQEFLEKLNQHQHTLIQLRDWSDQALHNPAGNVKSKPSVKPSPSEFGTQNPFDTLEFDRHSELHIMLQEALEELMQLEMSAEAIDFSVRRSSQLLQRQGRFLDNMRDDLMNVRMVPIGGVINRFPQVLRQLVEKYSKPTELKLKGTQVLVDKAIAEKLYDPLLHLVRNAFDHGIESAEVRQKQGKPSVGQIEISAYQQGNRTVIQVKDDGQGLNLQKICRRGFERGLLTSTQPEHFSKEELLNLLFEPGFSTAEQVSDLSGRGIGLDVVRAQLESFHGVVTVDFEPGQRTIFSLQLPLTLMTARLLVCQVGQLVYAFLSNEVEHIAMPQPHQIETIAGKPVFRWQQDQDEQPVPVSYLSELLSYSSQRPERIETEFAMRALAQGGSASAVTAKPMLLLRQGNKFLGILVDQILGEQELVIGPPGKTIAPPPYVYGCSILGDGRLILVVDAIALAKPRLSLEKKGTSSFKPPAIVIPIEPSQPTSVPLQKTQNPASIKQVLVVDDSVTIRQMLSQTLQKAGYQVLLAQDGLDAISLLRQHPEVQAITCDLEMPRMNGFEFLLQYQQELENIKAPVMMLTSRSNDKHRQLALQLGATAYMTKPYTEQELLNTVAGLVHTAE
jgi:chemotaxis family two-component system sensor histidine kinase/response regulator PixL